MIFKYLKFGTVKTILPINEFDRVFLPKTLCAKCHQNRSKRVVTPTHTHTHKRNFSFNVS